MALQVVNLQLATSSRIINPFSGKADKRIFGAQLTGTVCSPAKTSRSAICSASKPKEAEASATSRRSAVLAMLALGQIAAGPAFADSIPQLRGKFQKALDDASGAANDVQGNARGLAGKADSSLKGLQGKAQGNLKGLQGKAQGNLGGLGNKAQSKVEGDVGNVKSGLENLGQKIGGQAEDITGQLKSNFGNLKNSVQGNISSADPVGSLDGLQGQYAQRVDEAKSRTNSVTDEFDKTGKALTEGPKNLQSSLEGAFGNPAAQGQAAAGKLAEDTADKAGNIFGDVTDQVRGVFGQ